MICAEQLEQAAAAVANAEALLIAAGAGMGVDSGLPDFRGDQGFWRAYPPYEKLGLHFTALANPRWFVADPALAWGFYGHRLGLYRATQPHAGFAILHGWARRMRAGAFVFTSNVDGHFQRTGFDPERIIEVHGAIDWLQCRENCGAGLFSADGVAVTVEEMTMRAQEPLPCCPGCGGLARPNILMFGDWEWDATRTAQQEVRLQAWLETLDGSRLVILECGAGSAVPTVRHFSEALAARPRATLIRINPWEPAVPAGQIGLAAGALETLQVLEHRLSEGASESLRACIDRKAP